jgi:succinylglutamic semialdehyde dehydrogenase
MGMTAGSFHLGRTLSVSDVSGEWLVRSPANLELELGRVAYSYAQIPVITQSLREAQQRWCQMPLEARRTAISAALQSLLERRAEWDAVAQRELGRTQPDLDTEWSQFESFVRYFANGLTLSDSGHRVPRGVVAIIGTYIWPLVHTIQNAALALLAGNTVVLKPSEKATLCTLKAAEWFAGQKPLHEVFSVLVGDRELGRRLACHEGVHAIVFYGSFEVGMRIKQDTLSHTSKDTLLYLGAKNPAIVLADAPVNTVEALIHDAFLTTGQHCRSISQIWIEDGIFNDFIKRFHDASKQFKIGDPEDGAYAGPLIDPSMLDRYLKFTGISEREGASILMRGKPLELKHKGNYVTPTLAVFDQLTPDQLRKSVSLQTEILSPHVSLIRFKTLDEVQAWGREMTHGLVASVWTGSTERARSLRPDLPFGRVSLNQSTLRWDPAESFQAEKRSGNHAYQGPKLIEQLTSLRQ